MSRLLERLKRERLEKERKRAEREEKKRQKELEKKKKEKAREHRKATAEIRKKKRRSKENRRYYKKVRKVELNRRKKMGDVYAYHLIVIMQNNRRVKRIGAAWWLTSAYEKYNAAIEENRRTVKFPLEITEYTKKRTKEIRYAKEQKYEIMLIQKVKEGEDTTAYLRDKNGKFVENIIVDDKNKHVIIAKDDWYVPETFHVYGYHPFKDRKDFDFILNKIVLNNATKEGIRRVFTFNNKLIIQYDLDFDFVVCKTPKEAKRLYDALEKYAGSNEYVFFTGTLNRQQSSMMLNKLEEKTGWSRINCKRTTSI